MSFGAIVNTTNKVYLRYTNRNLVIMKKIILSLAIAMSSYCSYAQFNTNTSTNSTTTLDNVGIGTSTPSAKLQVVGTGVGYPAASGTTPSAGTVMRLRDGSNLLMDMGGYAANGFWFQATDAMNLGATYPILLNPNGGNVFIGNTIGNGADKLQVTGITGSYLPGSGTGAVIKWGNVGGGLYGILGFDPNGSYLGKFNGAPGIYLNGTSGYVGIGTASPALSLEVAGDPTTYGGAAYQSTIQSRDTRAFATGVGGGITFAGNYTALPNNTEFAGITGIKENSASGDYAGALIFSTRINGAIPSERLRITSSGNVLIGKTSEQPGADYKLDVSGSARADKIVVNTTGADFVFDKKYSLRKLSEVKSYIEQNQHLPEIPSAKEMQTNGVELGEMNKKLLQKVEELTLYLIDKDKQDKEKDVKLAVQEARIVTLEKALLKQPLRRSK